MRSEFMVERNGKTFCLYAGLLDEAHQQGLKEIRTTLLQVPTDENANVAICQSEVRTEKGVFTGLGDASPQNVSRAMLTCLIRMSETRAKARALRDAVNVGVVALEELDSEGSGAEQDEARGPASGRGPVRGPAISASPEVFSPQLARRPVSAPSPRPAPVTTEPPVRPAADNGGEAAPPYARATRGGSGGDESQPSVGLPNNAPDGMTAAQRRMLEALARQSGEQLSLDNLSRREASQLITDLKARVTQPRAA